VAVTLVQSSPLAMSLAGTAVAVLPARSTVQVAKLPRGAAVEIDLIAQKKR